MRYCCICHAHQSGSSRDVLVNAYNDGLKSLVSAHTPWQTKTIVQRPSYPWHPGDLYNAKHPRCKFKHKWRTSRLTVDHQIHRNQCVVMNKILKEMSVPFYWATSSLRRLNPSGMSCNLVLTLSTAYPMCLQLCLRPLWHIPSVTRGS